MYSWNVETMMWGSVQRTPGAGQNANIKFINNDKAGRYLALYGFSALAQYEAAWMYALLGTDISGTTDTSTTIQPLKSDAPIQPGTILCSGTGGGNTNYGAYNFKADGTFQTRADGSPWAIIPANYSLVIWPNYYVPTAWWTSMLIFANFIWAPY